MKNRTGKGSSPGYLLDRNLVPRIGQYALNHDITDVDDVVDHLRKCYKEYQRKQIGALRQLVVKAVQIVKQKGVQKPELQLQARDNQQPVVTPGSRQAPNAAAAAAAAAAVVAGDSRSNYADSSDSSSDEGEDDSDDDDDAAVAGGGGETGDPKAASAGGASTPAAAARPNMGLNGSLLNMYSAGKETQQQQHKQDSSSKDSSDGEDDSSSEVSSEVDPNAPPAFAPPHVIAAAAARALAAEKAEKAAAAARKAARSAATQQQQQGEGARDPSTPAAAATHDITTAVTELEAAAAAAALAPDSAAAVPAADGDEDGAVDGGSRVVEAAAVKQKKSRSAEEAGIGKDRVLSKKARRLGAAPGGTAATGGPSGNPRRGGSAVTAPRALHYADLGGVEEVLADIRELIEYPLKHPEVYHWLGVEPPRGVLLHGPPGCGKTALAHAIATECGVPFLRVSAPEVVSGMSGESEARLRQLFQEAQDVAPSIIFIDEIDAIAPKRETAQREMERRIVAQMLTCMDDLTTPPQPTAAAPHSDNADGSIAAAAAAAEAGVTSQQPQQQDQQQPRSLGHVVVIGATNRPDALDPALRRAGRFDREISLGIPTEAARQQILKVLTRNLRLQGGFDFGIIARRTPGFVGADLAALTKEAAAVAVSRIFSQLDQQQQQLEQQRQQLEQEQIAQQQISTVHLDAVTQQQVGQQAGVLQDAQELQGAAVPSVSDATAGGQVAAALSVPPRLGAGPLTPAELADLAISMSDFEAALPKVQPSVRREGFTTKPDATWEDVGSLEEVREELSFSISQPIAHPEAFAAMGLSAATGVLLYGPPGCGKTLVAKAVAAESGANFISIKGPELLNKYVGESERAVRQLFARARAAHPCVLFFDEMDALAPRRGSDNNAPAERLVNQLLTEMDGIDGRVGVYVVAATNRPDMIDPALLRPGRLDKVLYVPLPPPDGRASILAAAARRSPLGPGVLQQAQGLVRSDQCDGFSGADVAALVKEASVLALKEAMAAAAAAARSASGSNQHSSGGGSSTISPPAATPMVYLCHFEAALRSVSPSVSKRDRRSYEAIRSKLRGARAHLPADSSGPVLQGPSDVQPQHSGMEADGVGTDAAAGWATGGGDEMEGTDDAVEPADPMKD